MHYLISNLLRYIAPRFQLKHTGNLRIARDCYFDKAKNVIFGKNVFVNRLCQFHVGDSNAIITIGDSVWVGMDVCFICSSHKIGGHKQRAGKSTYKSITVGDGAWIGARSTILPGITIGNGSIIAAGSVVTKSVPPNELWGGIPALRIKTIDKN